MGWVFLFLASLFEIGWVYSLRFLDFKIIKDTPIKLYFENAANLQLLVPLLGYVGFGMANIYFFSKSMKFISTSTAFAVWMGITLVGVKVLDIVLMDDQFSWKAVISMGMILLGIAGLKWQ